MGKDTNTFSNNAFSLRCYFVVIGTAALNRRHGKGYEYGPGGSILYPAAGAEDDWAKAKAGIKYSYTMELRPGEKNNFLALRELLHKSSHDIMYHLESRFVMPPGVL